jgi:hypothetical protein
VPGMLMIGSAGRKAGKTLLACQVISRFCPEQEIIGIKVTTVRDNEDHYHHHGESDGNVSSFQGPFSLTRETERSGTKDTQRLLASGAKRVFWLTVRQPYLQDGLTALLSEIGGRAVSVCESNGLRLVAEPDLFLMVRERNAEADRPSTQAVRTFVDWEVAFDGMAFDIDWRRLGLAEGRWVLRENMEDARSWKATQAHGGQETAG